MEYKTIPCEDCAGRGVDPGSLMQPEECPSCAGSGVLLHPLEVERIARRAMGKARSSEVTMGRVEERAWRYGS